MKIGEKILYLRKKEGMSQEDLAARLDVSRQTVYKWESGAAMPEIAKIRSLAKMFGVSFDYLMDDDVPTMNGEEQKPKDPPKPTQARTEAKYRYAYNSGKRLDFSQADYDHGYPHKRKRKNRASAEIYKSNLMYMQKTLDSIGVDNTIPLQDDLAGCFFENNAKRFFGFYYDSTIQFICPYENFISSQLSDTGIEMGTESQTFVGTSFDGSGGVGFTVGSMPRTTISNPKAYNLIISYFDERGTVKQFILDVNCTRRYTIIENYKVHKLLDAINSNFAREKLNQISGKLSTYHAVVKNVSEGGEAAPKISASDFEKIIEDGKKRAVGCQKQLESAVVSERKSMVRALITTGAVILTFAVILLIAFLGDKLVGLAYQQNKDRQAAIPVMQLINSIEEVTLSDEGLLEEISVAYRKLSPGQQKHVSNYDEYTAAKAEYDRLFYEFRDKETQNDPTRNIKLSDLNGVWESEDIRIYIDDFSGAKSVWYGTYHKGMGRYTGASLSDSVSGMKSGSIGEYDPLTGKISGYIYKYSTYTPTISEKCSFTVQRLNNGKLVLYILGYTLHKK